MTKLTLHGETIKIPTYLYNRYKEQYGIVDEKDAEDDLFFVEAKDGKTLEECVIEELKDRVENRPSNEELLGSVDSMLFGGGYDLSEFKQK